MEIVARGEIAAEPEAGPHGLVNRQIHAIDDIADIGIAFGADDLAGKRSKITEAMGEGDLDDLAPSRRRASTETS